MRSVRTSLSKRRPYKLGYFGEKRQLGELPSLSHFNFSVARQNMRKLISQINTTGKPIVIDLRNRPSVIIADYMHHEKLLNNTTASYEEKLATLIIDTLLEGAPLHIKQPRINELSMLKLNQLKYLLDIKKLPIPKQQRASFFRELGEPIIRRLESSKQLLDAMLKAEAEGIYDRGEDATGEISL